MKILKPLLLLLLLSTAAFAAPEHSPWPGGVGIVPIAGAERPGVTVDVVAVAELHVEVDQVYEDQA